MGQIQQISSIEYSSACNTLSKYKELICYTTQYIQKEYQKSAMLPETCVSSCVFPVFQTVYSQNSLDLIPDSGIYSRIYL